MHKQFAAASNPECRRGSKRDRFGNFCLDGFSHFFLAAKDFVAAEGAVFEFAFSFSSGELFSNFRGLNKAGRSAEKGYKAGLRI